jgi:hypothetical protein
MVGATTLALFFVPLFYYLIRSATERLSRRKTAQGGGSVAAAPSAPREED